MADEDLDILFVADARFSGGTSTAVAAEISASRKAGLKIGLLHVPGPILRRPRAFHRGIRTALDSGDIRLIDPAAASRCRLLLVHHPTLFPRPLRRQLRIQAERAVLVAHHPPLDGLGRVQYDIRAQVSSIELSFGCRPEVAPVGPNVRTQFLTQPPDGIALTPTDWHNLIDLDDWSARPPRPFGLPIVIGRHSRPDPLKWLDTREQILAAYPEDPRYIIRVLGAGPFLADILGTIPANWQCLLFDAMSPRDFLAGVDVFVYFHSVKWVEAFGYGVLEALASGLPAILPDSFRPLFGSAALYGQPADVSRILQGLAESPHDLAAQSEEARAVVRDRFSIQSFAGRLDRLYGLRARRTSGRSRAGPRPRQQTILFLSSNGIGLGHLTRQMAVARRLPVTLRPVFFTLSRALPLVQSEGFLVEHVPFHRYLKADQARWNQIFARELVAALRFHQPEAIVFDGNVPYSGLLEAIAAYPRAVTIWIRRAMWRDHHGSVLRRSAKFEAVVEPEDIAGEADHGPTVAARDGVLRVGPVIMVRPTERLSRQRARELLGVEPGQPLVAMQLGSGNNFDFERVRHALLEGMLKRPEVTVLEFASPIAERALARSHAPRHGVRRLYPTFRYSEAFDCVISAAGYNSFHESILGGVPTLFVPNDAEEMDQQRVRARYAADQGLARLLEDDRPETIEAAVATILDPAVQTELRARCALVQRSDGAMEIAQFIEETLFGAR